MAASRCDPAPSDTAPSDTAPSDTAPSDTAPSDPAPSDTGRSTGGDDPTLLDRLGGPAGFVWSTVPVVVFVTADAVLSLPAAIAVSLAVGLGLTGVRLLRGERVGSAIGSLLGIAAAAGVVAWTGSAKDFFAIGIWASLAGFVVTSGSVLVRRPITGVVWNALHGGGHTWRTRRAVLRAHDVATLAAALVFGSRFAVQQWLYLADSTSGLGVARIVMGVPLTVLAALAVVRAFRRSTTQLVTADPTRSPS